VRQRLHIESELSGVQVQGSEGKSQRDNKGSSNLEVCEARLIAVIVISSEGSFSQDGSPNS
jgi:hypothetical protein